MAGRKSAAIVATVFAAHALLLAAQEPPLIGLVREDGYLIPIATITEKLFETPIATETMINGELLPSERPEWRLRDVEWTLFPGAGKATAAITTLEPLTVDSHCTDQAVWRTTLKLPAAPKNVSPINKIGLAVRGAAVEHPQDVLTRPDAASGRVARLIVSLVHRKELERLSNEPKEYLPPYDLATRAKIAVQFAQLRRHRIGGSTVYYFEATKGWGPQPDFGLVTGWIVDSPSGLQDHDVTYKFNDDVQKENDRAKVWGVVRYRQKALWMLEWHGYESEYYILHDWPSGIERANIGGGSC